MNCVITAGPTYEPLDDVRRLTNFSTGQLGCELASYLTDQGHAVTLLLGDNATYRGERNARRVQTFTTTADLREQLEALSGQGVEAVFHAAAVSDFRFGKIWLRTSQGKMTAVKAGKIPSREETGTLLAELIATPKVLAELRQWFPKGRLIGWKYEVDGKRPAVLRLAQKQLAECLTDACVANGPAYGEGFGLVTTDGEPRHMVDKSALFGMLDEFIRQ
jgi:phosphopantothenoylcysteine decarboxylase/phosphopantothenate--cysteine ligase